MQCPNQEAHSPPTYYATAACWYNLGRWLGLRDAYAFYWMRFFSVPVFVGLVLVTGAFAASYLPEWQYPALLVMVALFPSTAFLAVGCDGFSAFGFALAFYLLLRWSDRPDMPLGVAAGLATAAVILVKLTNLVILVPCAILLLRHLVLSRRSERWSAAWLQVFVLVAAVSLPVAAWMVRNRLVLGDWTGDAFKLRILGWSMRREGWFDHPLLTAPGESVFWTKLVPSFWFGDVSWRQDTIPPHWLSVVSIALSPVLLVAAALGFLRRPGSSGNPVAIGLCLVVVSLSLLSLVALSMVFDFGSCPFPSRDFPYLFCGRLILGMLVPFLTIMTAGADVLSFGHVNLRRAFIGIVCLMMLVDQYRMLDLMLPSHFNWFHLPH
jgi:hypothetical protein